jgi:hypothetical protein
VTTNAASSSAGSSSSRSPSLRIDELRERTKALAAKLGGDPDAMSTARTFDRSAVTRDVVMDPKFEVRGAYRLDIEMPPITKTGGNLKAIEGPSGLLVR